MDKYLINILKEVNTIIIPGIGALTIVNQATGEVMFMSFMKFDDGKLAEFIAEKEQWELNEAKNLVSKYVRDINTKLDQGDSYDIYQFGSFTKNVEGEIEFNAWNGSSDANSNSEISNEPIAEVIIPVVVEQTEKIEEPRIQKNEITEQISETIEVVEEEVVSSIEEPTLEQEISTDDIETIIPVSVHPEPQVLSVEEQLKDDLDVPPINLKKEAPKKPILEKTKKDKIKKSRGVGFYILLGVLIFLIGGGTYFGLNYQEMKQYIPFLADKSTTEKTPAIDEKEEKKPEKETNDVNLEEVSTEEAEPQEDTQEQTEAEVITPQPIATGSSGIDKSLPIQVIVGSFSEESNATRKAASLVSQGMKAEVIGQYGGLYFVSAGSYSSMEDLKSHTGELGSLGKYWVFKK